ncbi:arginyl-tRNA--protein transferase 2 isoform X2 [Raphanus sativus]|uniref:Arginyl-tRNA--protein transferase n=1 Tax=Raphanus sativus TaxID=3726 RepID=A0A9W3BS65_RAPSA|nr:arginyl-tRNA--protein transferase 2 isoform X2 [Raphanus sativus]
MSSRASSSRGGESIVADCGRNTSSCGYCKSPTPSSISHALLDRGWRRSGCYLYKPEMAKTCCPSYTIRLRASDFVPSKEQQRVRRRLERFLEGEVDLKPREQTEDSDVSSEPVRKSVGSAKREQTNEVEPVLKDLSEQIDNAVQRCIQSGEFPSTIQVPKSSVKKVLSAKRKKLAEGSEELLYTSNIAFPIVAAIKQTQTSQKGEGSNNTEETSSRLSPETVSEMLLSEMNKVREFLGLAIKVCKGHINFFSATQVHSSETDQGENLLSATTTEKSSSNKLQVRKRKLEIHLKRSSFDQEEYELYKRYQLRVHNDEPESISKTSYKRFLVDTPLIEVDGDGDDDENVPPCGFGSYHQQYRVDGRLIAVGVIDILPKCLSSKYLFWDPDLASLSLGNYSALQEIDWVKQNQAHCSALEYYYLGYYIHSCNKMRYKAAYRPSELLCPLRYQWVPFEVAKPLLDKKPYAVLSDFTKASLSPAPQASETLVESTSEREDMEMNNSDEDSDSDSSVNGSDIANILISLNGAKLRYKELLRMINMAVRRQLEPMFISYQKVVGAELSERMVYELQ